MHTVHILSGGLFSRAAAKNAQAEMIHNTITVTLTPEKITAFLGCVSVFRKHENSSHQMRPIY